MGHFSKWKGYWRVPLWLKVLLILIGIPLSIGLFLSFMAIVRAIFVSHQVGSFVHIIGEETEDLLDEARSGERALRFANALKIATISYDADIQEKENLLEYIRFLEKNYPLIHKSPFIKYNVVNNYSLLYTVQGTVEDKVPYLLASHLDVVPVDKNAWEIPPFSGKIVNETYIYGRGAIDDKAGVMGIMEAVEYMLEKGYRPHRTFFIAFGHDEEVTGIRGAREIARTLLNLGIRNLDFVLDEGFPIHKNLIAGTDKHIAMVGVSEKGTATLELSVRGTPGHSSFPPSESAIGILAAAVAKLEENPQPGLLGKGPELFMFKYLAPHVTFGYRILYSNMWLFSGLMSRRMEKHPIENAIVRTTTAITMFNGGIKSNVIPPSAKAIINHRIHPAQSVNQVVAYDKKIINDPRITIKVKTSREAHPVSPFGPDSLPFQLIATSIKQVYPDSIVIPAVFIANTDTRWYLGFTKYLYRFLPAVVLPSDISRYHGNNERISIRHFHQAINFYYRVIKNADSLIDQIPTTTTTNKDRDL